MDIILERKGTRDGISISPHNTDGSLCLVFAHRKRRIIIQYLLYGKISSCLSFVAFQHENYRNYAAGGIFDVARIIRRKVIIFFFTLTFPHNKLLDMYTFILFSRI